MKTNFAALLAACLFVCAPYLLWAIDGNVTITSGGKSRSFVFHAPGSAVANNLPLVFVFHGDGGSGAGIKGYSGFDAVADTGNFIVVYPNADSDGNGWHRAVDQPKDVTFTSDMIDYFCSNYHINPGKVYATGHSAGGYMTYNLALNLSSKIAAFSPVAGNMYANGSFNYNTFFASAAFRPVPIYHIHGDPDPTVTYIDPNHVPDAWNEWPLNNFAYYSCGTNTYNSTVVPIVTNVSKLVFCSSTAPNGKEIALIRVQGVGHGWPTVNGFNPASNIWNFFNKYSITSTQNCAVIPPAAPPDSVMSVAGKNIVSACGAAFLPRGVNYSLLDDWNFPANLNNGNELSTQIIKAKPNTVRIEWYNDYGNTNRPAFTVAQLDSVVSRFYRAGIVSIIDLHDLTGQNDSVLFQTRIINYWKSAPMLALLQNHKSHIMVGLANEYGPILYPPPSYTLDPNYATKIPSWVNVIKSAIVQLRAAGIEVPIMVDAPNYGHDMTTLISSGATFNAADIYHSIVLSPHAYWDGQTAAQIDANVQQAASASMPVMLGEVANVGEPCTATIDLNTVLQSCQTRGVGWLAWTWYNDNCPARQVSANGLFTSLSAYGQIIVNNATYGLAAKAVKMDTSCAPACVAPTIPTLGVSPSSTICTGSAVMLSISGGGLNSATTWQWFTGSCGGTAAGTGASIQVSPTATTTYYVRGQGGCIANGSCASIVITVTNKLTPSVTIVSNYGNPVCVNSSVTFTATPTSGGSSPSYQWIKNNVNVGTNSPAYSDSLLKNNDSVWVVMTSSAGCVTTPTASSKKLKIGIIQKLVPGLDIRVSPSSNICAGTKATFTATYTNGGTAPSFQWIKNNVNVGTNSPIYYDSLLNNKDSIWVIYTSNATCVTANVITSLKYKMTVTAKTNPAINIVASPSTPICSGTSVMFTASSNNAGSSPIYQWKKNNLNVGSNSNTYSDSQLNNNDSVWVELTSSATCTVSLVISIKIKPVISSAPVADFLISDTEQCLEENLFQFTSTSNGASSYSWSFGDGGASVSTSPSYSYGTAGNYTVKLNATNSNGCSNSMSKTVTVLSAANIGTDQMIGKCIGSLLNLNAAYNNPLLSYNWDTETPSAVDTGVFTVIATTTNGCKDTAIITVYNYAPTKPVYTIANVTPGLYDLIATDVNGCKDSATIIIIDINCETNVNKSKSDLPNAETSQNHLFNIKPNPAFNMVYIEGNNLKEIKVLDSNGKQTISRKVFNSRDSSIYKLDISSLAKGFYIVMLQDVSGKIQSEKLVVQ